MAFRYQCFATSLVAADYRNAHRLEKSDKIWTPFDYVRDENLETDEERKAEELENNKAALAAVLKE